MKKLVIKTACITFAVIILLIALTYGIFVLFIPRPLADFFYNSGSYSAGIRYYEKQYEKTEDIEDLYTLCLKLDENLDVAKVKQYTFGFINHSDFASFSAQKDIEINSEISTKEYFEGKYVCAVYADSGMAEAISAGNQIIDKSGYTEFNCFNSLIISKGQGFSAQDKLELKQNFATLVSNGTIVISEYDNLNSDLALLRALG